MNQKLNTELFPSTNQPKSAYQIGDVILHQASHNRFQEYKITNVEWDAEAMFGAGCYIYTIDFVEWDSSSKRTKSAEMPNWRTAEVNLPIRNLIPWEPRITH